MTLTIKPPAIRDLIASALAKNQSLEEIMERFEHSVLVYALKQSDGDWIKAAALLQIGYVNFQIRMQKSGIEDHFPRNGVRRVRA